MKKEFCWIVLILALITTTRRAEGSAASTFTGTTPMAAAAPTNAVPSPLMLPADTNIVEVQATLTFQWRAVTDYQFGPLTYDIGSRTNATNAFVSFANTTSTNYTTTNVPVAQTEYAVQAVSTNLVGTNLLRSIWSKSVFFPPDPPTNIWNISLWSTPHSTNTNWVVVTSFANWTNPPTVLPGVMGAWKMQTNKLTTNITELVVVKSTNLRNWSTVYTVTRWTNSPPATRWKLDFGSKPL